MYFQEKKKQELTPVRTKAQHISSTCRGRRKRKKKQGKNVIGDNILSKATCVMQKRSENRAIADNVIE
jgi:hypothetical protein